MATLEELVTGNHVKIRESSVGRRIILNARFRTTLEEWFKSHGFEDFTPIAGSYSTMIIGVANNEDYVIRMRMDGEYDIPERNGRVVPQIVQPFYSHVIAGGSNRVTIEFLPRLNTKNLTIDHRQMLERELEACNHGVGLDSDGKEPEFGLFTYTDAAGKKKTVPMLTDPDYVYPTDDNVCTKGYPTLQDQYRRQCEIVKTDPRLKKMIGGMPPKLPTTRVLDRSIPGIG